jgi:hypothetical protein
VTAVHTADLLHVSDHVLIKVGAVCHCFQTI